MLPSQPTEPRAAKNAATGKHMLQLSIQTKPRSSVVTSRTIVIQQAAALARNSCYSVGAISIGPGITCGVVGTIIWARGIPGGQSGGGHTLQRSPRLNQLPPVRQLWQPAKAATTTATLVNRSIFFDMIFLLRNPALADVSSRQL
jgi:hypothetical protein